MFLSRFSTDKIKANVSAARNLPNAAIENVINVRARNIISRIREADHPFFIVVTHTQAAAVDQIAVEVVGVCGIGRYSVLVILLIPSWVASVKICDSF